MKHYPSIIAMWICCIILSIIFTCSFSACKPKVMDHDKPEPKKLTAEEKKKAYLAGPYLTGPPISGGSISQFKRNVDRYPWIPSDYFSDPKVIELCNAIDEQNVDKVEELIRSGAKVNTLGKSNHNSLLWCYPSGNQEIFELLLKNGADPNIQITKGFFGSGQGMSVVQLASIAKSSFFLRKSLEYGGNPNPKCDQDGSASYRNPPLCNAVNMGTSENALLLIEAGADLDISGYGIPLLVEAVSRGKYGIACKLIEAGADINAKHPTTKKNIAQILAAQEFSQRGDELEHPGKFRGQRFSEDMILTLANYTEEHQAGRRAYLETRKADVLASFDEKDGNEIDLFSKILFAKMDERTELIKLLESKGVDFDAVIEEIRQQRIKDL